MTMRVDSSSFLSQMRAALDQVGEMVGESTLRKVGVAGAVVLRDEAKLNAISNKKTGTIYHNIIIKHVEEKSDGSNLQTYYVMVRSGKRNNEGDAYYWRWVETGHNIVRRKKQKKTPWKAHREAEKLEFGDRKVPPNPFMRPAYDAKQAAAVAAMKATLAKIVQGEASAV